MFEKNDNDQGQIFDACRISATRVSAPERCFIYYWRKCLYLIQLSIFLQLRQVSLRYDKRQKFDLYLIKLATDSIRQPNYLVSERASLFSAFFQDINRVKKIQNEMLASAMVDQKSKQVRL